jgi:flagellar protein FlgJ
MALEGLSSLYNTTATTAASSSTSKLEQTLDSDLSGATDDELMDVCKEFESYFLEQMFKAMADMVPEDENQSSSTKQLQDYYKDEMIQQLASDSTENNSLGLAQTLYEQMKRNYNL